MAQTSFLGGEKSFLVLSFAEDVSIGQHEPGRRRSSARGRPVSSGRLGAKRASGRACIRHRGMQGADLAARDNGLSRSQGGGTLGSFLVPSFPRKPTDVCVCWLMCRLLLWILCRPCPCPRRSRRHGVRRQVDGLHQGGHQEVRGARMEGMRMQGKLGRWTEQHAVGLAAAPQPTPSRMLPSAWPSLDCSGQRTALVRIAGCTALVECPIFVHMRAATFIMHAIAATQSTEHDLTLLLAGSGDVRLATAPALPPSLAARC